MQERDQDAETETMFHVCAYSSKQSKKNRRAEMNVQAALAVAGCGLPWPWLSPYEAFRRIYGERARRTETLRGQITLVISPTREPSRSRSLRPSSIVPCSLDQMSGPALARFRTTLLRPTA
jgi:hypothetical protein